MYSVVLATMLTTGTAAPAFGFGCHGCHGCHGCYGCYGCCGGCYGCYGCYGGCYGCSGCYGCYGCCGGCWGGAVAYSYPSYYYSCYGCCGGCYGAVVPAPVAPVAPKEKLPPPGKQASAGQVATVIIAAPADVQITFNGEKVALKGTEQAFITPELEADATYSYLVEARTVRDGQPVTRSRKLTVTARRQVRVDFSELAAVPVPAGSLANR